MPRDLFGDVIDPSARPGSGKWYTVPLSLAVHTIVLLVLVIVPLLAAGALPMPASGVVYMAVKPPELPRPPTVKRAEVPREMMAARDAAPTEAPSGISKEPEIDPGFEAGMAAGSDITTGAIIDGGGVVPPPVVVQAPPPPTQPVRPGGQIKTPERVKYVAPVYSPVALAARVQGVVIIEAVIGADGRVQDARVLRSQSALLDDSALAAVRQWVYTPTLLNGVPVPVIMTVTVRFQLQ